MEQLLRYRMSRRAVLGAAAGLAIGWLVLNDDDKLCAAPAAPDTSITFEPKHNMWVWRFDVDGPPAEVLERVRGSGLGVILKTNEGHEWMGSHDDSPTAITGPEKVREMATFFESAGVPFHAWCTVKGIDPLREAEICSEVLNAGARSMTFDLEPQEGKHYWQADKATALEFGREIRRRQPHAALAVAPDARPWQIDAVPLVEFASFCDEILPQAYWQTFNSPTNRRYLTERGYQIGPEGVTPEVILDATADKLRPLGKVIRPIGQGAAGRAEWDRFIRHAYSLQMDAVSVWRYGTASGEVWGALQALPPVAPQPPVAVAQQQDSAAQQPPVAAEAPPATDAAAPLQARKAATSPSGEQTQTAALAAPEQAKPAVGTEARTASFWRGPDRSALGKLRPETRETTRAEQVILEACKP